MENHPTMCIACGSLTRIHTVLGCIVVRKGYSKKNGSSLTRYLLGRRCVGGILTFVMRRFMLLRSCINLRFTIALIDNLSRG